jgi:Type I phosphodiesterase / nucleotide pyrophosphatase
MSNSRAPGQEFAGLRRPTAPPITGIRERIRSLISNEIWSERRRDIIILAVDGVRHGDARRCWPSARNVRMSSVFPTTSATAWLSSVSGAPAGVHGVPGVMFHADDSDKIINVFHFTGSLPPLREGNLFSDAADLGYDAIAVLGDLRTLDCSWRDRLVENARVVPGRSFYAAYSGNGAITPEALREALDEQVEQAEPVERSNRPRLIWIFVDLDRYVHRHGYDDYVASALIAIEHVALEWTRRSALVVAYSDHGLVPSVHDPHLEALVEELASRWGCSLGGAGRTRWIYSRPEHEGAVYEHLRLHLPSSVRLAHAETLFPADSVMRRKIGSLVLIAEGKSSLTMPGYCYDHGSWTDDEVYVPFSVWGSEPE